GQGWGGGRRGRAGGEGAAEPQTLELEPWVTDGSPSPAEPAPLVTSEPESESELEPTADMQSPLNPEAPASDSVSPPPLAPPREPPPRQRRSRISPHARPHRVLRPGPYVRANPRPSAADSPLA